MIRTKLHARQFV